MSKTMSHEEVSAYEAYIVAQAEVNACEDIRESVALAIAANTKFMEWRKAAR